MAEQFQMKGWFRTANAMMTRLVGLGISFNSTTLLTVPGRKSGVPRTTPVSILTIDGERYVQAPFGEVDWVRNLRAAGGGTMRVGRREERIVAQELTPSEAVPVIREVLRRAPKYIAGQFEVTADSPAEDIEREAPRHPAFRLRTAPSS